MTPSSELARQQVAAPAAADASTSPWWAVVRRWAVLGVFLACGVTTLLGGSVETSLDEFEASLASGEISVVHTDLGAAIDAAEAGERGRMSVRAHWRDGIVPRHVDVDLRLRDAAATEQEWRALASGEILLDPRGIPRPEGSLRDWVRVPGWVVLMALLLPIATVARIIAGPEPRFLTRWAWFWTLWVPWLGAFAFWLLGDGARWGEGRQKVPSLDPDRRVSGLAVLLVWFGVPAVIGLLAVLL